MDHPRGSSPPPPPPQTMSSYPSEYTRRSSPPPPPPPPPGYGYRPAGRTFATRPSSRSPPPPPPPRRSANDRYYERDYYYRTRSPVAQPPPHATRYSSPPPPPPPRYASPPRRRGDNDGSSRSRSPGRRNRYRDDYPPPSSSRYDRRYYDRYDDTRRYDRYDDRRYARSSYPRKPRRMDRGSSRDREESTTLFIGNLPYDYMEREVASMFERYGKVNKVTVPVDSATQRNKGFAFVEFDQRREAEDAFERLDKFSVEGRRLKLDWDIGLKKKDEYRGRRFQDRERLPPPRSPDRYASPPPPPPPLSSPPPRAREYRRDSRDLYRR
ncbi:RNA-binding domain-containing protein [Lichtheimia hyalospora FSU 10163]|nr:RNA-binding domain-containing protein [Lichtheimia hyalospora FSU 10163]